MFADIFTITWRNLLALTRTPEAMFFSTLQPIMFVLLFAYVFGGAISIPHLKYIDFLIPGIFVQTVSFGSVSTAVGLSEDLQKGLIERFRALPMARSAVLAGRTTADLARNVFVVALMTGVGYAVGFRIGTNIGLFLCGILLVFAVLLRPRLGLRHRRALGFQRRDGAGHGLPHHLPVHLRLVGLRAGGLHAGLAAGLRQEPTGDPGGQRRSFTDGGRAGPRHQGGLALIGLDLGAADRAGARRRAQVPPGGLAHYSSPVRRRSSLTRSLIGTRTCSVVSRSRTVTASSSRESKSTVTHQGVPTSSWRR